LIINDLTTPAEAFNGHLPCRACGVTGECAHCDRCILSCSMTQPPSAWISCSDIWTKTKRES
jgi:hypothetical protein